MNDKVGIIGYGVVGKAAAMTLGKYYKIIKYDKYQKLNKFSDLIDCKFVFIMVPTPFDCLKNEVDDSAVLDSLNKLSEINFSNTVIIKSTLPPGNCDKYIEKFNFNIVFNPEFLRESTTPNEDFQNQDTVVIGTTSKSLFSEVVSMFKEVLVPHARYYHTSLSEAEMIKCAQNTMLASRVAIANMIYDACQDNNIQYQKVKEIAFDGFKILGPHMVQVPGPDGKRGFGGKCLPKDIRAFSTIHDSDLLHSIIKYNDRLRTDLEKFLLNYNSEATNKMVRK